jgi:hypothetical protein
MQLIAYIIERKVMNLIKRIVWLFFYFPRAMKTQIVLAFAATKRFFNRPTAQAKALGAGLAGGMSGAKKALRKQNS